MSRQGPVGVSKFEGHGRGLVDNRPRMTGHADDSPTSSENLAQVIESEQATRFEAALEALAPNTRRAYLQERASDGAGISSLRMTVAALRKVQALVGVEPTANDQIVTDTISGLARQAAAPRQAYALTAQALAVVTATACQPRVGRGGKLESPRQGAAAGPGRYCAVPGAVGRGPAALGGGCVGVG